MKSLHIFQAPLTWLITLFLHLNYVLANQCETGAFPAIINAVHDLPEAQSFCSKNFPVWASTKVITRTTTVFGGEGWQPLPLTKTNTRTVVVTKTKTETVTAGAKPKRADPIAQAVPFAEHAPMQIRDEVVASIPPSMTPTTSSKTTTPTWSTTAKPNPGAPVWGPAGFTTSTVTKKPTWTQNLDGHALWNMIRDKSTQILGPVCTCIETEKWGVTTKVSTATVYTNNKPTKSVWATTTSTCTVTKTVTVKAPTCTTVKDSGLLKNGGFEDGLNGWNFATHKGSFMYGVRSGLSMEGCSKFMMIPASSPSSGTRQASLSQEITLSSLGTYKFGFYAGRQKSTTVVEWPKIVITYNGKQLYESFVCGSSRAKCWLDGLGGSVWQKYDFDFTTYQGMGTLKIEITWTDTDGDNNAVLLDGFVLQRWNDWTES